MPGRVSILDAYRSGLSLKLATFKYAPPELLKAFCEDASIRREQEGWSDERIAQAMSVDAKTFRANPYYKLSLAKCPGTLRSEKLFPSQHLEKLQIALFDGLRDLKRQLVGYLLPRSIDDLPILIPPELIQLHYVTDWDSSVISGNGLVFVAVRVVPAERIDEPSCAEPRNKLGRRSRKDEIIATYSRLRAKKIRQEDERGTVIKLIYEELKHLGASGLSAKTIWRHVSSLHQPETKGQKDK